MQVLEQWCTKKHSSKAQIYLIKVLRRLSSLNNEDWSLFIEEKSQTSR